MSRRRPHISVTIDDRLRGGYKLLQMRRSNKEESRSEQQICLNSQAAFRTVSYDNVATVTMERRCHLWTAPEMPDMSDNRTMRDGSIK